MTTKKPNHDWWLVGEVIKTPDKRNVQAAYNLISHSTSWFDVDKGVFLTALDAYQQGLKQ